MIDEAGFAPLDDTVAQLLFRGVAAAYERRALGVASHWPVRPVGPVPARAHHRRQPAGQQQPRRARVVVTDGDYYRMREARAKGGTTLKNN